MQAPFSKGRKTFRVLFYPLLFWLYPADIKFKKSHQYFLIFYGRYKI